METDSIAPGVAQHKSIEQRLAQARAEEAPLYEALCRMQEEMRPQQEKYAALMKRWHEKWQRVRAFELAITNEKAAL